MEVETDAGMVDRYHGKVETDAGMVERYHGIATYLHLVTAKIDASKNLERLPLTESSARLLRGKETEGSSHAWDPGFWWRRSWLLACPKSRQTFKKIHLHA